MLTASSARKSSQNLHGLVQRLVQKERQVLQLQAEVDRFKSANPTDGRDAVRVIDLPPMGPALIMIPTGR